MAGRDPNNYDPPAGVFDTERCPGRKPFDLANQSLGQPVKTITALFEDAELPVFDVLLHLGVLYHCENPMLTCRKLATTTGELVIIETLAWHDPRVRDDPQWRYIGDDSVNNDPTTCSAPTAKGLAAMLKAVGFQTVALKSSPQLARPHYYRLWVHALK